MKIHWLVVMYAVAVAVYVFLGQQRPPAEEIRENNRVIVLMCYKRVDSLLQTLASLKSLQGIDKYHLVVTQTVDPDEPHFFEVTSGILRANLTFMEYTHIKTDMLAHDGSFSVNQRKYGSKRNSIANMINGVEYAYHKFPKAEFMMIMEDDVVMSPDILNYFERCKTIMREDKRITFATSYYIFRGTHPYFDHIRWEHHLPRYRPNPMSILTMEQRTTTFKTFFWMMRRSVLPKMSRDFRGMVKHRGETLHELFKGCEYCENYCYDHWVEWVYRGTRILVPEVPRAAQYSVGGMTTPEDKRGEKVLSNYYNERMIEEDEYIEMGPMSRFAVLVNAVAATAIALLFLNVIGRIVLQLLGDRAAGWAIPQTKNL